MESIIELNKVSYEYAAYEDSEEPAAALRGIDLSLKPGQFIAVIGHNGSGKSTLAKHLNALLLPTEGTVWVCGMDTKDPERLWEVRQSAGWCFRTRIISLYPPWWRRMWPLAGKFGRAQGRNTP